MSSRPGPARPAGASRGRVRGSARSPLGSAARNTAQRDSSSSLSSIASTVRGRSSRTSVTTIPRSGGNGPPAGRTGAEGRADRSGGGCSAPRSVSCHTPSSAASSHCCPSGTQRASSSSGSGKGEALVDQQPVAADAAHDGVRQPAQGVRQGPGDGPAPPRHPDQHGGPALRRGWNSPLSWPRPPASQVGGLESVDDPAGERPGGHDDDLRLFRRAGPGATLAASSNHDTAATPAGRPSGTGGRVAIRRPGRRGGRPRRPAPRPARYQRAGDRVRRPRSRCRGRGGWADSGGILRGPPPRTSGRRQGW